jgi:hypothetical protein
MPPIPLPAGWIEVRNTPQGMGDLEEARLILNNSSPQYQGLDQRYMIKRMHPRKIDGYYLFNLRVFLHSPDIAAFFFLRKRSEPVSYCLSPGAISTVAANNLLDQLVAISGFMKNEDHAPVLDTVSSVNPPAFTNQNLGVAFANAVQGGLLTYQGIVSNADGWPARLYRWTMVLP